MKKPTQPTPAMPVIYSAADVSAVQAIANGDADEGQQKRFIKWLIEVAAGTYDFHFYASERDTSFALGKAFVGQQVVKMLKLNASAIAKSEERDDV